MPPWKRPFCYAVHPLRFVTLSHVTATLKILPCPPVFRVMVTSYIFHTFLETSLPRCRQMQFAATLMSYDIDISRKLGENCNIWACIGQTEMMHHTDIICVHCNSGSLHSMELNWSSCRHAGMSHLWKICHNHPQIRIIFKNILINETQILNGLPLAQTIYQFMYKQYIYIS